MNKGFLMFSDEEPGLTMLKDEPEDLTHLAPVAGDVCVPLEDCPLISDMLNDFLGENYCPLFTDDLHSLDSECSKTSDPFISYQDEYDDNTSSTHLLSPSLSSKSPECSIPSLSSPGNSLGEDDHMNTFISIQMDSDEPELSMKAPYIPMSGGDEFPLLTSNDLMWNAIPNQKTIKNNSKAPDLNSSLAHLLCSSVNKSTVRMNDHGGGLIENKTKEAIHNLKSNTEWRIKTEKISHSIKNDRTNNKRTCNSSYDYSNKRTKNEPKENSRSLNSSSELLQQLISNNNNQRQKTKGKGNNWLLNSNGKTAACVSQPSDSVLMNLLQKNEEYQFSKKMKQRRILNNLNGIVRKWLEKNGKQKNKDDQLDPEVESEVINIPVTVLQKNRNKPPDIPIARKLIRKNSSTLMVPDAAIPSLLELTQQDFEVNAPVNNFLLQGADLLKALEISEGLC